MLEVVHFVLYMKEHMDVMNNNRWTRTWIVLPNSGHPQSVPLLDPLDGWKCITQFHSSLYLAIPFYSFSFLNTASILWLILLNPWPWTLPHSYLYKEPILSCSSLVLTLVPIRFNPLCFAHKPLEVPFAQIELNSLLLSLPSTERECKLVTPITKGQNYFCVHFSKRQRPHHVKTLTVSLAKEAPSLEEDWFVWN